jgi:hypothetical protein
LASRLGSGAVRIVAVVIVMFLAIVYLKLGYFIIFLLPLGALIAILLTRKQRVGYPPVRSYLVAIVTYCAATAVVWSTAIQHREEMRELKWEGLEPAGRSEPEVRLHLGGSHYLISHSAELGQFLRLQPNETVAVSLPVTRTLGCFQSVGPPRIEGWGVAPLGGYGAGTGEGPWEEHWWCP